MKTIEMRYFSEVNTDSLRRCYNGCHFKSEILPSSWYWIELHVPDERVDDRLKMWRELNKYSVSVGGNKKEYRTVPAYTPINLK